MTERKKPPIVSPFEDDPIELPGDSLEESSEASVQALEEPPGPPPPPPWEPSLHPITATIHSYTPGLRLIYEQGGGYGSASLVLLASLLFGWLAGTLFHQLAFWIISCVSIGGLYVLIMWKSGAYESILWRFDLDERRLTIFAGQDTFSYDLNGVSAVGLVLLEQDNWWSSTLAGSWRRYHYKSYNAQVLLEGLLEDSDLVIAETGFLQRDRWQVHHMGLCLAHMLAETLGAPLHDLTLQEESLQREAPA